MPVQNPFVGESLALVPDQRRESAASYRAGIPDESAPRRNLIPDGTEWTVALIALVALGFLTLLEVGGFKTVLAASITTGR